MPCEGISSPTIPAPLLTGGENRLAKINLLYLFLFLPSLDYSMALFLPLTSYVHTPPPLLPTMLWGYILLVKMHLFYSLPPSREPLSMHSYLHSPLLRPALSQGDPIKSGPLCSQGSSRSLGDGGEPKAAWWLALHL